jgi:hypothetical protein
MSIDSLFALFGAMIILAIVPGPAVFAIIARSFSSGKLQAAGQKESLSYWDICNQFIHSSIFAPFVPVGKSLVGFYIASDRAKKKKLYYIQLKVLVEMLESIGNNYPKHIELTFNEKAKEYKVSSA